MSPRKTFDEMLDEYSSLWAEEARQSRKRRRAHVLRYEQFTVSRIADFIRGPFEYPWQAEARVSGMTIHEVIKAIRTEWKWKRKSAPREAECLASLYRRARKVRSTGYRAIPGTTSAVSQFMSAGFNAPNNSIIIRREP